MPLTTAAADEDGVVAVSRSKRQEKPQWPRLPMYEEACRTSEDSAGKQLKLHEQPLASKKRPRALGETCAQAMLQGQHFRQYLKEHSVHPSSSETPWWSETSRHPLVQQLNSKKSPTTAGPKVRGHGDLSWPMQDFRLRERSLADEFPLPCMMYRLEPASDWYSVDSLRQAMKTKIVGDFPAPYFMFRDYAVSRRSNVA